MSAMRGIRKLLRIRFTRAHLEREVDEEVSDHIARRADVLMREGLSRDDAYAEATRRFGDLARVKQACLVEDQGALRRNGLVTQLDHLRGDVRHALRSFKRAPGFAAVALVTLAVGIGSVTAIFSAIYGYAYRPLPYKDSDRMIAIEERRPTDGFYRQSVSLDAARAIIDGGRSFDRVTIYDRTSSRVSLGDDLVDWETLRIDTSFAAMFVVQAQLGRVLTADEIEAKAPVAMISDVVWRSSFGADTSIVGRRLRMGDDLVTVVGVMPPGFRFPMRTDVWRPARSLDSADTDVTMIAKMRRGVTREAVATELRVISRRLSQIDPVRFDRIGFVVVDMLDRNIGGAMRILALFIGAAVFVLLIACTNVANLLLVRSAERRGEMAVRASLGAGRARLVTQTLTEAIVLSLAAGAVGTLLSKLLLRLAMTFVPTAGLPSWMTFELDARILLFTFGIVSMVTLVVGLTPAREGTRFDLVRALKTGGDAGAVRTNVARSARRAIVVQLALSVTLFVGGALLVQSYRKLSVIDLGYPAHEIASVNIFFPVEMHGSAADRHAYAVEYLRRVSAVPGVRFAAIRGYANTETFARSAPSATSTTGRPILVSQRLIADGDTTRNLRTLGVVYRRDFTVTDDYFKMLGLRIQRGRSFAPDDIAGSPLVAVVSQQFAETVWPASSPIGRELQFGTLGSRIQVVGVVDNVRDIQGGRDGVTAQPRYDVYFSTRQVPSYQETVLARGPTDLTGLQIASQRIAREIDPRISVRTNTMAEGIESQQMVTRVFGTLIGGFAVCGLVLSIIGIYGVVAYGINQRTRELGIRIALGGTSRDVLQLIMSGALRFVSVGLVIGLALALATTQLLRVVLLGVSPTDPVTYLVSCVLFGAVALLACYLPARRVTRIDPLLALRSE